MDEDPSGPPRPCGSGMDDSRLCVCLAGPFRRYWLAAGSARIVGVLVALGYPHAAHSLGGPAAPIFQQAACPTNFGASASEPAGNIGLHLPCCGGSRRYGYGCVERLAKYPGFSQRAEGHVSLELAGLLAELWRLAAVPVLRTIP